MSLAPMPVRQLCYIFCSPEWGRMKRIPIKKSVVRAANGKYEVLCGRGVLERLPRVVSSVGEEGAVFVISSPRVWQHWGARIEEILGGARQATIMMDDRQTAN